ncbi:uncharacterized protein [Asterias amurensis]|uniref:uncharacterized protein n=1 Tax=Asterias amurensis TaxID=7602 RepID=UPI003AB2E372
MDSWHGPQTHAKSITNVKITSDSNLAHSVDRPKIKIISNRVDPVYMALWNIHEVASWLMKGAFKFRNVAGNTGSMMQVRVSVYLAVAAWLCILVTGQSTVSYMTTLGSIPTKVPPTTPGKLPTKVPPTIPPKPPTEAPMTTHKLLTEAPMTTHKLLTEAPMTTHKLLTEAPHMTPKPPTEAPPKPPTEAPTAPPKPPTDAPTAPPKPPTEAPPTTPIKPHIAWPKGTYALPKPVSLCPYNHYNWKTGFRYHDTQDTLPNNQWSDPLHLLGPYYHNNMQQNFCVKTDYQTSALDPEWEKGNYCIMKKGEHCPNKGFNEGWIKWDDQNLFNKNKHGGVMPEGVYDRNTKIYFCCREDGDVTTPIVLPSEEPFFLFRKHNTCQRVLGMKVHEEWFKWDGEDDFIDFTKYREGSVPDLESKGDNHKIMYCYYS